MCLVKLSIYVGERRIGGDRGVLWFAGDRLHFAGKTTSFVLGGQDVVPTTEWPSAPNTLTLRHPSESASLILVPLAQKGPIGEMRRACFAYRFEAFRRHTAHASGRRQWPPLRPWRGIP